MATIAPAAHDIGLAGLVGGNVYGRFAGSTASRRYGLIKSLSLVAVLSGWFGVRLNEAPSDRHSKSERRLASLKDILVALVAVTGLAAAIEGTRFARMAPEDEGVQRVERRVKLVSAVNMTCEVALVGVSAALARA